MVTVGFYQLEFRGHFIGQALDAGISFRGWYGIMVRNGNVKSKGES